MLCSGASCHHVNVPSCATSDATWRHPGSLRRAGPLKSSSNPRAKIVPTKPPRSNCRSTTTGTSAVLLAYNARAMAGSLGRNRMQTNEVTCGTSNLIHECLSMYILYRYIMDYNGIYIYVSMYICRVFQGPSWFLCRI